MEYEYKIYIHSHLDWILLLYNIFFSIDLSNWYFIIAQKLWPPEFSKWLQNYCAIF